MSKIMSDDEKRLCQISIKYIERLLEGHHPVNNSVIENDTVLMDENVQRCFSFISDILKRISEEKTAKSSNTIPCAATFKADYKDVIDRMIQDREVKMSEMETLIRPYLKELFVEDFGKIPVARISNWLVENGYLVRVSDGNGVSRREASRLGLDIGMVNRLVDNGDMSYMQYKFTPNAQRFLFENLDKIALYKKNKESVNSKDK